MNIKPNEQDISESFYKTLVESIKALPWQVDWETMAFSYVGPQIKEMFGWNVEDWAGSCRSCNASKSSKEVGRGEGQWVPPKDR